MKAIDIRGTNTRNKGAHLMLMAVHARLSPLAKLSAPTAYTDFDERARLGLWQTAYVPQLARVSAVAGDVVPGRLRADFGVRANSEIDGIVDASGFHYTDQFKPKLAKREALIGRTWAKRSIPKVLLPQAFGPFENPKVRRWTAEALNQASLVFARDGVSLGYLQTLDLSVPVVRSPDFTIELHPPVIDRIESEPFVAIVPNGKMLTHGKISQAEYTALLEGFAEASTSRGLKCLVIVHESTDQKFASELADRLGVGVFADPDPLVLKAVLGQAEATVASRFHAVVSSLSQGIPTLAFGWSHKYGELLSDFDVPTWEVDPSQPAEVQLRDLLADDDGRDRLVAALPRLAAQVDDMWTRTIKTLGLP